MTERKRAPRNQTLSLSEDDKKNLTGRLIRPAGALSVKDILNKTINDDFFDVVKLLPGGFADLVIVDPPYNLDRKFNKVSFNKTSITNYTEYIEKIVDSIYPLVKEGGAVYFCSDWYSSTSVHLALDKYFNIKNRITWEREKGRGARANWKNNSEDIWFAVKGKDYTFNVDAVKLKRNVIAPYRKDGKPKDWNDSEDGKFRLTFPSNLWNDISIPFWSMPENTDHPTQKPEKLIAKIILASSNKDDIVFDPFLGSGTTSVTAKKLDRKYIGIEVDEEYACLAEKRIELAEENNTIQGYDGEVFYERNSFVRKNENGKQNTLKLL